MSYYLPHTEKGAWYKVESALNYPNGNLYVWAVDVIHVCNKIRHMVNCTSKEPKFDGPLSPERRKSLEDEIDKRGISRHGARKNGYASLEIS